MTSFEIHGAEGNVAVWKKDIPILSFINAGKRSDHWLAWCNDPGVDASTPAADGPRLNQSFGRNNVDYIWVGLAQNHELDRRDLRVDELTNQIAILVSD
ncbi:hypothetical protein BQ8794_240201 [Mesorhizobium prunaredense]|uniref:Uncharacterized protein n=1 Tax=Mesorhizobium prunaredense TaxID=1631249 RepID=A0A1R3V7Z7_9HYPH|nr:hypothetical protein BQ8794_240201 [Mesorhizobium prunaredense]